MILLIWAILRAQFSSLFFQGFFMRLLPCFSSFWLYLGGLYCLTQGLSTLSDSVDFSYSKGYIFLFYWGLFRGSSSTALFFLVVLSSTALSSKNAYHQFLCRWRVTPTLTGWFHPCKQVVNRLKIPQGLSTLMFRRWSEVPSRGGVRGDSP